jgi:threonine aldolase
LAGNSNVSVRLLTGDRGRLSVEEIAANINSPDTHYPVTSVVALENTVVREAGSYYTLDQIRKIAEFTRSKGLHLHLDGARFFNALAETGDRAHDIGSLFDTVSICLSKGLGAPVGSVLVCKKELETKVRRMRKVFGGGMRQAGFLAAAGIYALDHHIKRLREDHARAKEIGKVISARSYVKSMMPVDTNIIIFELADGITPEKFLAKLGEHNIKALPFSATEIRMVMHLDVDDRMLDMTADVLKKLSF